MSDCVYDCEADFYCLGCTTPSPDLPLDGHDGGQEECSLKKSSDPPFDGHDFCAICINPFGEAEAVKLKSCKHTYHYACLREWTQDHKTCPMCRATLFSLHNDVYRLYLGIVVEDDGFETDQASSDSAADDDEDDGLGRVVGWW